MRTFYIVFIQVLVLIKSFDTQDYKNPMDYNNSEDESDSDSFEFGTKHTIIEVTAGKNVSEALEVTEKVTSAAPVTTAVDVIETNTSSVDGLKASEHPHPTRAAPSYTSHENCKSRRDDRASNEDKATTTLINYPFSVSIQKKGAHYATGALVDKRWILSTAGDFFNVRESIKLFRARLGSVDCKKGGSIVPLKRVELHPSYVFGEPNFDLALLRMAQPVDYTDFIRPIGLSKVKTKVISAKFMTTYWPRLIIKGQVLPAEAQERIKQNSMRVSTQRLIPREKCLEMIHNITLDESTLCLKPFITHHSLCMPDSGAPVVAEDGLWGITSGWTSPDCLQEPNPTMFSRISAAVVRSWLDTQLLNVV